MERDFFLLANDVYENASAVHEGNGEKELFGFYSDLKNEFSRFNKCKFVIRT